MSEELGEVPGEPFVESPRIELERKEQEEGGRSYEEGEIAPNLSDLQTTLGRLFPQFPYKILDDVVQSIMVARVAPDMFLDAMRLTVNSVVMEMDYLGLEINVISVIQMVYAAFTIGLDGKGRIDILEVAGAAKETEELEKLSRQLNI